MRKSKSLGRAWRWLGAFAVGLLLITTAGISVMSNSGYPTVSNSAQDSPAKRARFAGMVCIALNRGQLREVTKAYGEECGVFIETVAPGSAAEQSGIRVGDILISVQMPGEDEFYPIPPVIDDMIQFGEETKPVAGIRLLLYRKEEGRLKRMEMNLDVPGSEPPIKMIHEVKGEEGMSSGSFKFISNDPDAVATRSLNGYPLTNRDIDIYGGVMAWSFGTRLTEEQKQIIHAALREFWPQAPDDMVQMFRVGILSTPHLIPRLPAQRREELRVGYAQTFIQMAQGMGRHPLAQVIMTVSAAARNVLAGAGTTAELTLQDAQALLEYLAFQTQMQTGQVVMITPKQRIDFINQVKSYYLKANARIKKSLASMDESWAVLRARWAAAAAARQQAVIDQWQRIYAQQRQAPQWRTPFRGGYQGGQAGGGMSDSQFDAVMGAMNTMHQSSLTTLGAIDGGYDTEVYDSAGQWLYEY